MHYHCAPQMALQVDALTPSQPYGAPSDGVCTPSSGAWGTSIPHARPMSPGAVQPSCLQSSAIPISPTASLNGSSSSMVRTSSEREREKEKNLYPNRVIISSQLWLSVYIWPKLNLSLAQPILINPASDLHRFNGVHLRPPSEDLLYAVVSRHPSSCAMQ